VTEVRAVGDEAFDEIYPLLREFPTERMTKEDWRRMLFSAPWSDNPQRGFALYADGKPVGFIGTIFSKRRIAGRVEPVCSLSSWIMLPDYRSEVLKLLMPILKLTDHSILNPTPSPAAYGIFSQLGFVPLESERLILPPVPGFRDTAGTLSGTFTTSKADLERQLTGEEATLYEHHSWCAAARHVLLHRGQRQCYVVATSIRKKRLPFAEIQYASDWNLFWDLRVLAHAALFPSTRAVALFVDKRFADGRKPPLSVTWRCPRLYRPAHKGIEPRMIDGLYSEMMNLKW
jgi:hypothetical protein